MHHLTPLFACLLYLYVESRLTLQVMKLLTSYQTRMLMSVEIVSGCKLFKLWVVHQVLEVVTLGDIYCGVVTGTVESGSSFQMPPERSAVCLEIAKMDHFKVALAVLLPGTL